MEGCGPAGQASASTWDLPWAGFPGKFAVPMPDRRTPLWLWPNLLSLDAPIVAVAWLHMFRKAWGLEFIPPSNYLALGLGVWAIYVADRLLDLKLRPPGDPSLGRRHEFHGRHRMLFLAGLGVAVVAVLYILLTGMPVELLRTYSVPALGLVLGFFSLVMAAPSDDGIPYTRNIVAGVAFGFGTASIAHVRTYEGVGNLIWPPSPELACFAVLCVLNISAIHLWEDAARSEDPEIKAADELSLTLPLALLGAAAVWFAYRDNPWVLGGGLGEDRPVRPFFYAVLISAALLYVLNRARERFSIDQLRCLADLAMLVPLPLFLVLTGS